MPEPFSYVVTLPDICSSLKRLFDERKDEIYNFLDYLEELDSTILNPNDIHRKSIKFSQINTFKSTVYIMLYNITESIYRLCINSIWRALKSEPNLKYCDLNKFILTQIIYRENKLLKDLSIDRRNVEINKFIINAITTSFIQFPDKSEWIYATNVNDLRIEETLGRFGVSIDTNLDNIKAARQFVKDELGTFELIRTIRNGLAHGHQSFNEATNEITYIDLKKNVDVTINYLNSIVDIVINYIVDQQYLLQHIPSTIHANYDG